MAGKVGARVGGKCKGMQLQLHDDSIDIQNKTLIHNDSDVSGARNRPPTSAVQKKRERERERERDMPQTG